MACHSNSVPNGQWGRNSLKGEDRMTGRVLVSCLIHSDTLSIYRHVWGAFCIFLKFLSSTWSSPFNTSLLGVDWFSSNNCLKSFKWLRLPIAYPSRSGVKLKWKKKLCRGLRCEWKAFPLYNRDENVITNIRNPDFLPFHTPMSMAFIQ